MVIHWFPYSQRSTTLAHGLGYEVHLLRRAWFRRAWTAPFTYPVLAVRTAWLVVRRRPAAVVIIAPPIPAVFVVLGVSWIVRARVAIDVHSGALLDRRWRWSIPLLAWAGRRASACLVTLPSLARRLQSLRVRTLVLPDPVPDYMARPHTSPSSSTQRVVAVCGWGRDEPISELIESARGKSWELYLTGASHGDLPPVPANVHLTGFLDDDEYLDLLAGSSLVVVLTRRDETLLSGAWEALAVGKPLLVSATPTLVSMFGPEVASAANDSESIGNSIDRALSDPTRAQRTAVLAEHFRRQNADALDQLLRAMDGPGAQGA
jgi:glycosyltransferase involved in cell wall biosynthesis